MSARRRVGDVEVVALRDATAMFPLHVAEAFAPATSGTWDLARRLDPEAFAPGDAWRLAFRCYALRRPDGRVTLVDLGAGGHGSALTTWVGVEGVLPGLFRHEGIDAAAVDSVVLTHLHSDHLGWAVDSAGEALFGGARHVLQGEELRSLAGPAAGPVRELVVDPLRRRGLLDLVTGSVPVVEDEGFSIRVLPTPGHTAGHQSVRVTSGGRAVLLAGDAFVHAVQVVDPSVTYTFEDDPEQAVATRTELLAQLRSSRGWLGTPHTMRPFLDLARVDGL